MIKQGNNWCMEEIGDLFDDLYYGLPGWTDQEIHELPCRRQHWASWPWALGTSAFTDAMRISTHSPRVSQKAFRLSLTAQL